MANPKSNELPILIASNTSDRLTTDAVAGCLGQSGYEVAVYDSDKMARGETSLVISITGEKGIQISYNGKPFGPDTFAAAWYRRPSTFVRPDDAAKSLHVDQERIAMQGILWHVIPDSRWLNPPDANKRAEAKLQQLSLAQTLGFTIPDTLVTNDWQTVHDYLPSDIVLKMWRGIFYEGDKFKCLYTKPLRNSPDELPTDTLAFPGIWQPFLKKLREWRITVVGDKFFDAAIYTSPNAKDDWRRHELNDAVEFRNEPFPDEMKDKCLRLLGALGCRFGCFDFIEDDEGRITFLEMNPNGQYYWLEKDLGLPISRAIAKELISIAQVQE
jgi:hypothetical protein